MANDKTSVKQTAIEWYSENDTKITIDFLEGKLSQLQLGMKKIQLLEQARQKEKEQTINSFIKGFGEGTVFGNVTTYKYQTAEEYYNETYGKE